MKKFIVMIALSMLAIVPAFAGKHVSRDINDLPATAQTLLKKYFNGDDISRIKIEQPVLGSKKYDVTLDNGTEIEFDHEGNWKEIDCGHKAVPNDLVIKPIRDYVKKNFNNKKIVKIEIKSNKYEVELSTGAELIFDRAGNFLRLDD